MRKKKAIERLRESYGKQKEDDFDFGLIAKYFRNKDNSDSYQVLSNKTCNDLDFEELFMLIDRSNSKVGQQFLYNQLRNIHSNSSRLELREKIIRKFSEESDFRIETQRQLEKLNKDDAYYITSLFQEEHTKAPKWFFVIRLLSFTSLLSLLLIPFHSQLAFVLIGVFIVNLAIHYWNKKNLYQYLGSIPQLLRLNSLASNFHKEKTFVE